MAGPALRRRRGTRNGPDAGMLRTAMLGCILIAFGLSMGMIVGLLVWPDAAPPSEAVAGVDKVVHERFDKLLEKGKKFRDDHHLRIPDLHMKEKLNDVFHHKAAAAAKPDTTIAAASMNGINHLRRPQQKKQAGSNKPQTLSSAQVTDSWSAAKKEFMDKVPDIGSKGAFPYLGPEVPENFDFSTYLPKGGDRFAEWIHGDSPYTYPDDMSDAVARSRRVHVKNAMKHAWDAYKERAFGSDEVLPVTGGSSQNWGGMGTTLVDALDTLWLMDMKDEFYEARDWVRDKLSHSTPRSVSVFETTIRSLGGLLSAYDWSGDKAFLDKAHDLGSRLFKAFDGSPSGIPFGQVSLEGGRAGNIGWTGNNAITAEFGTLQLEFRLLARLTGERPFKEKVENIYDVLIKMNPEDGLYPYFVRNRGPVPEFANRKLTFGAMGDSLYEYMLKIWIQGGKVEKKYRDMYDRSIQGMHEQLLQLSSPTGLVFIADKNSGRLDTKMDHLVCFMGGLLALGAYTDPLGLDSERAQRDLKSAKALTYTCYQMYARMNTGISAEYVQFYPGRDFDIGRGAPHYLLRPETVESFFVLYQLTRDPVYREWGWEVFQAIEKYCKAKYGYGQLKDVSQPNMGPQNKMESFFLAETLKYLYLLQDPDTPVDVLNKHVFNTEAHPVRIFPLMDKDGVPDKLK